MRAVITTELSEQAAIKAANEAPPMEGSDFVKEVSTKTPYLWEGESRLWTIPKCHPQIRTLITSTFLPLNIELLLTILAIKHNILRSLRQSGFEVEVVNSRTTASEVLAKNPDGVFLSNGPGDPAAPHLHPRRGKTTHRESSSLWNMSWTSNSDPLFRWHHL